MTTVAHFSSKDLEQCMWSITKSGLRCTTCRDFYNALFQTKLRGASVSQALTASRSRTCPPLATARSATSSLRSASVSGRTGFAVIEVSNVIKARKENLYDVLKEFQPECRVFQCEGPRAYARVRIVEEDMERIRDLIKQLGKNRGNKDVQVKRVQADTP